MRQLGLHVRIRGQGQREAAFGSRQAAGPLEQPHPAGAETHERPPRGALFGGAARRLLDRHLQLTVEVVGHDRREQPSLIGGAASAGDVIHLGLGLQLREDRLLRAAPVVQRQELSRRERGVGEDHLELVPVFVGSEEIQLQGSFALFRLTGADEDETPCLLPAVRLPVALEELHVLSGAVPEQALLDFPFQLREALEGYRDRVLDAERIERVDDLLGEERAVHAHLEDHVGQDLPDFIEAGEDERASAVRVVHVAGTVPDIEDLPGLCYGTEQRIVAPLSFLLFVVPDRRALRHARGTDHRAVEVQRQACRCVLLQPLEHQRAREPAQLPHRRLVHPVECATDGRHIRQALQPQRALHHRVVLVVAQVREPPIPDQKMHDQQHHDRGVPEDGADRQVIEAPAQPALQPQALEQGLEHHETGERGQLLVLETDLRQRAGFPMYGRLANLHTDGRLSGLDPTCGNADHNRVEAVFSFQTNNLNDLQRSPKVRVAEPFNRASQAGITGADASASEILCTWRDKVAKADMKKKPDAQKLDIATQTHLRRTVVRAVRGGMSQTEASKVYGASLRAVSKWRALERTGGLRALKQKAQTACRRRTPAAGAIGAHPASDHRLAAGPIEAAVLSVDAGG